jgi:hypothetical protein
MVPRITHVLSYRPIGFLAEALFFSFLSLLEIHPFILRTPTRLKSEIATRERGGKRDGGVSEKGRKDRNNPC